MKRVKVYQISLYSREQDETFFFNGWNKKQNPNKTPKQQTDFSVKD